MGYWGPENFASDAALDWYLIELGETLCNKIRAAMADPVLLEPDDSESTAIVCALEVLTALNKHVHPILPDQEEVSSWKETYFKVWDDYCERHDWHYPERRKIVWKTFQAALRQAKSNR